MQTKPYYNYKVLTVRSRDTKLVTNIIFNQSSDPKEYIKTLRNRGEVCIGETDRDAIYDYVYENVIQQSMKACLRQIKFLNVSVDTFAMYHEVFDACCQVDNTDYAVLLIYDTDAENFELRKE